MTADDPFGTAALRARVLRAWTESPARFREDANTEEDHALGGYRDRVVVELAQNAADAAARAGVPGRLQLALRGAELTAANTGAPLDAAGAEALSTLRASAKRDDAASVGRFGVGFAAVAAVSDAPSIVSGGAGVRWSAAESRELVAGVPELAGELDRRGGHVPLLRLPFPAEPGGVPDGFATLVRLPLRDDAAVAAVARQLAAVGPALLLALPALESVEVEVDGAARTVVLDPAAWTVVEAHGTIPPELLADRPVEERGRPGWSVRWALPAGGLPDGTSPVLHAPTPSDEPLDLPALLIATFPLGPDRRRVAPGALTRFLAERAADAYVELLRTVPPEPALLDLVPGPIGAGELDAAVRRAVRDRLPDVPLLPGGLRGRDTVVVDAPAPAVDLLAADVIPNLLPPGWPARHRALDALGVRRTDLADVVDALAAVEREPEWWHGLYEALSGAPADALGALPVPLASGRLVRGPRGLLVADGPAPPPGADVLDLRFVHPAAAHPLLLRLGAVEAGPREVLTGAAVRRAVAGSFDADDPRAVADAVLALVAAARLDPGEEEWLADLALDGADGEPYPAGELLLPDSPLRGIMADDAPFGIVADDLLDRFGADALAACGVLSGFAVVRAEDVDLVGVADGDAGFDLDDEDRWAGAVLDLLGDDALPPLVPEFAAVRDLELVADWPAALRLLAAPPWRAVVVEPVRAVRAGRRVDVPSYTAWWLRGAPVLDGRRPGGFRAPGADPLLAGLYDEAPGGLDEEFLLALGVRTSLAALLAEPGGADELLDRLADPSRVVDRAALGALWTELARVPGLDVEPPDRVRALVDGAVEVVDAADALVLDRPDLLPLLTGQPLVVPVPADAPALAAALDLPLASDEVDGAVESAGERRPVPDAARAVLPDAPAEYVAHDPLVVDGRELAWWADGDVPHAATPEGLARALAWITGRWHDRLLAAAVLRDPAALPQLLTEADLED
ncbi:sacsin N-terminal ATP-binding-like domain-containing protein [Actinomadura atramentaria]|uniref:sacsin N-terminal ATP-binding-like domain-containing protein n=1 Tax=Actinomadura atramentaria TaxID=1990 RepID=UPI00036B6F08|nr:hypothetical protein [Actinomadura atramentaria]